MSWYLRVVMAATLLVLATKAPAGAGQKAAEAGWSEVQAGHSCDDGDFGTCSSNATANSSMGIFTTSGQSATGPVPEQVRSSAGVVFTGHDQAKRRGDRNYEVVFSLGKAEESAASSPPGEARAANEVCALAIPPTGERALACADLEPGVTKVPLLLHLDNPALPVRIVATASTHTHVGNFSFTTATGSASAAMEGAVTWRLLPGGSS